MPPAGAAIAPRLAWDVSEQGESLLTALFPHLAGLRVHRVEDIGHAVVISASCRAGGACCPRCGQESARVHGGYSRVLADGAAGGRPVLIVLAGAPVPLPEPAVPGAVWSLYTVITMAVQVWVIGALAGLIPVLWICGWEARVVSVIRWPVCWA